MTLFLKMKRSRSSESSGAAITGTAAAVATEAGSSSPSPAKRVKLDARTQNQLDLITSVPVIRDYKRRAGGRRGSVFVTQDMLIDTLGGQVGAQLGLAAKAKGGEGASSSTTGGGDASSDEEEKDVRPPAAAFSLSAASSSSLDWAMFFLTSFAACDSLIDLRCCLVNCGAYLAWNCRTASWSFRSSKNLRSECA